MPEPESEAGPSSEPVEVTPSSFPVQTPQGFSGCEDFIAFDDDEEKPVREWDRGKRWNERDEPGRGHKRQWDESDRFQASREQESRRDRKGKGKAKAVPWAKYVDWGSCRNAAEL